MVKFITELLSVVGKNTILVLYDRLSKIVHFVATTKRTSAKGLVRLFRDNVWKLCGLPKSVISDKEPYFVTELTKELSKILGIEIKLSTVFYSQTNSKTEHINEKLKQYLLAEFVINNKIYSATKIFLFMVNYGRELRMKVNIRKKEKVEKATEFAKRIKKVQEEARVTLKTA